MSTAAILADQFRAVASPSTVQTGLDPVRLRDDNRWRLCCFGKNIAKLAFS